MARTLLQILSFCLLIYLCAAAFMGLDFTASMHTGWESYEKTEIDTCSNIEAAKQLAREKLHTIELIEKKQNKKSYRFFVLLMIVIVIQGYLFATMPKQSVLSEKMVE
jgi:hypothetical protein